MTFAEFLQEVTNVLAEVGVPYMVTGSLASSLHGAPRSTQDVDLVVEVTAEQAERVVASFQKRGFYVSEDAAQNAVSTQGQFNVIDGGSGWKADLIVRKDRPFSVAEFGRRRRLEVLGTVLPLVSPEDLVIAKLEWWKLSDSERQLRDIEGILRVQGEALDVIHIDHWVHELGLEEAWNLVKHHTQP